jgi:transcriptional regulator GlxA family with amidase domain
MRLCQPRVSALTLAAVSWGVMITTPPRNDSLQFVTGSGDRAEPVEIWKARKLIRDHSDGELSLTEVARSVNLSANYLSEKFKEVTGINFVRYIGRTRVARARDLLGNSNLRISEIAFAVGFQSLSQFNRVFKKLTRQSPTEYRGARRKRRQ